MSLLRRKPAHSHPGCQQCGAPLEPESAFCAACGASTAVTRVAPAPAVSRGGWRTVARRTIALVISLAAFGAIGLWPSWSAPILERFGTHAGGRISPSAWLAEGPVDPIALGGRPLWASVSALAKNPSAYSGSLVLLTGEPVAVVHDDAMTLARFEEGSESMLVGYAGRTAALAEGESVSIAGVLSPDGREILALAASRGAPVDPTRGRSLARDILAASLGFLLAAVFLRIRRGRYRKRRAALAAPAALMALALLLGGCDITITTKVEAGGSGTVETRVLTGEEMMAEVMDLPNAEAFTDSWLASMERDGVTVTRTTNQLRIDRTFRSLEDFGAGETGAWGSWSRLGAVSLPDGRHTFLVASFDTASIYPDPPEEDADTSAYDKLTEELNGSTLRYVLELPGTTLGSNADDGTTWDVPMGGRRFMFAESVSAAEGAGRSIAGAQHVWAEAIRWLWALVIALLVWTLTAYPWRKREGSHA